MAGALEIALSYEDVERHLASAHCGEAVAARDQIARHQREQIGGLGPGIVPFGPVVVPVVTLGGAIAVGEQDGELRLGRAHPHGIDAEHIGPVGEEGDPAEALGLALRAEHAVGGEQPHQLRIARRVDLGDDGQFMGIAGQGEDQIVAFHRMIGARLAVAA